MLYRLSYRLTHKITRDQSSVRDGAVPNRINPLRQAQKGIFPPCPYKNGPPGRAGRLCNA
ncbi:hypothetical protein Absy_008_164 [Acetobacter syzygii]|nr:hypothetical protein Absy_008_164 [Acetobacter syzygii]